MGALVFALSALTALLLLNYIAKQLGNLIGKGLEPGVVLEFFVLSLPFTVAMTFPMAVLVAVLFAFSRLAAENEITAMKASGISMRRLMVPPMMAGALLAILMIIFNDQVLPRTNHRLRTLQGDIARKKPSFALKEQIINEVSPGALFLRSNRIDPMTNRLTDVTIYDLTDPLRRRTIYADSGEMGFTKDGRDLQLTLFDGFIQEVPKEQTVRLQRVYFGTDIIRVKGVANAFERDSSDTYRSDREMSVCELQREVSRYERDYLREYDRFERAREAFAQNPTGTISVLPGSAFGVRDEPDRSRIPSLGRSYCDGLRYLEQRGFGQLTSFAWNGLTKALLPSALYAAVVQDTIRDSLRKRADTTRPRPDTVTRSTPLDMSSSTPVVQVLDSAHRAALQVAARMDSVRLQQLEDSVRSQQQRDSIALRATTDSLAAAAAMGGMVPTPPSFGLTPEVPVSTELESARNQMLAHRAQMNGFEVEIHKKFAISAACFVFVLLGAPLALRFPRGGVGVVISASLIVFSLYYVGLIAGEALADRNLLRPSIAMWAANILFTIAGLFLIGRMEHQGGATRGEASERWERLRALFRRRRKTAAGTT